MVKELIPRPLPAKARLHLAYEENASLRARIAALEAQLAEMTRRRDEWRKKAEGYDDVRRALREKVGTPWPPHMSRLLWAGIAADEKKRADDAEAQLAARTGGVKGLTAKLEEIRVRVEKTMCPTWSSDGGDQGEQGRISRQDFDTLILSALSPAPEAQQEAQRDLTGEEAYMLERAFLRSSRPSKYSMKGQQEPLKQFDLVRFASEKDGGPVHRVVSVMSDGMIELHDMGGYFAPHLFVVAPLELNDEAKGRLAAIDDNIRNAAVQAASTIVGSTSQPAPQEAEPVAWRYKLRGDEPSWTVTADKPYGAVFEPLYTRPAEQAVTDAMKLARAVLAHSMTAGHNVSGPTPEDIEKAFWALDDALKAAMEAGR